MNRALGPPSSLSVYLNGATVMTTPTARLIEVAREAGFDGVEVRAERLLGARAEVRSAASVVIDGEVWSLNGIQLRLRSNQTLDRARVEAEIRPRLEICSLMHAAYLLVVPPRGASMAADRTIDAMREGLQLARDKAAAVGARVAFEFLGFGDCAVNTPALAAAVVEGIAGVELVLDASHWHASGSPSLAGFPIDRLAMVHLNDAPAKPPREIEDADRVLPGEGVIALANLVGELGERGYRGPFSVETFNPAYWVDDPRRIALRARRSVADLLDGSARIQ
jgi:2-keto-myo-inositol isomerase